MADEVKHSLIWATALVLVVASIAWSISFYHTSVNAAAFEQGYSEQTLQGAAGVHWVSSANQHQPQRSQDAEAD